MRRCQGRKELICFYQLNNSCYTLEPWETRREANIPSSVNEIRLDQMSILEFIPQILCLWNVSSPRWQLHHTLDRLNIGILLSGIQRVPRRVFR